jgi:hypothetical protein
LDLKDPLSATGLTVPIHSLIIFQIFACLDLPPPFLMGLVPLDGSPDPFFKGDGRPPSQFSLDLGEIHGITPIMAWTILDISNQGMGFSQLVQNGLHHQKVRFFTLAPYVVNLSCLAMVEHGIQCPTVIFDIDPIPDVHPVAVNREFFIFDRIGDQ